MWVCLLWDRSDCYFPILTIKCLRDRYPLLEDLSVLSCNLLSEIKNLNLNYLKRVTMDGFFPSLEVFSIKASSLERLCFYCNFTREKDITFGGSWKSESQDLRVQERLRNWWVVLSISKFPLQESMKLTRCSSRKRLWILNPLLKKIMTEDCNNLNDIRIERPELSSFYYEGNCSIHRVLLRAVLLDSHFLSSGILVPPGSTSSRKSFRDGTLHLDASNHLCISMRYGIKW